MAAQLSEVGSGSDTTLKGYCPDCVRRGRRGAIVRFGKGSSDANDWLRRHMKH